MTRFQCRGPLVALAVAVAIASRARAEDAPRIDAVGTQLPADTAFYSSMLRNREQVDIVAKSKAWAALVNLPAAKAARKQIEEQLAHPDPQAKMVLDMLRQPENQELLAVLTDAVSDEIFIYGGSTWVGFTELLLQTYNSTRYGPTLEILKPDNRGKNPKSSRLEPRSEPWLPT